MINTTHKSRSLILTLEDVLIDLERYSAISGSWRSDRDGFVWTGHAKDGIFSLLISRIFHHPKRSRSKRFSGQTAKGKH